MLVGCRAADERGEGHNEGLDTLNAQRVILQLPRIFATSRGEASLPCEQILEAHQNLRKFLISEAHLTQEGIEDDAHEHVSLCGGAPLL